MKGLEGARVGGGTEVSHECVGGEVQLGHAGEAARLQVRQRPQRRRQVAAQAVLVQPQARDRRVPWKERKGRKEGRKEGGREG